MIKSAEFILFLKRGGARPPIIFAVGNAIEKLERTFADWVGVPAALSTGFGRSALLLALEAAGVKGWEVAVPDFVCSQVPEAVRRAGGRPVLYPVLRDLRVRAEEFRAVLGPMTRAAIVVHYFGRMLAEVSELAEICRGKSVTLIEDWALALGASSNCRHEGSSGELAVFSFTKSDWCYGGGMVIAASPERAARLRCLRTQTITEGHLQSAGGLLLKYGVLRRADFAANRPRWNKLAAFAGRSLERMLGFGNGNFYDQGRFDAQISGLAARRALHLLAGCNRQIRQRQAVVRELEAGLRGVEYILARSPLEPGDSAAFLLLYSPAGRATEWVKQADRDGVTLRLTWPAYQTAEVETASEKLAWLARHLVVLEIHPRLSPREIDRITGTLKHLAEAESAQS